MTRATRRNGRKGEARAPAERKRSRAVAAGTATKRAPRARRGVRCSVGVISDTHGLLRPEAITALRGVQLIVHAGDIGSADVLAALATLAPVVAVRGNNDRERWARRIPLAQTVEVCGSRIHVLHDVHDLRDDPARAGYGAVISGHSHRPLIAWRDGVLYLNPGSAGRRRFTLPVTVARLSVARGTMRPELVELVPGLHSAARARGLDRRRPRERVTRRAPSPAARRRCSRPA